MEMGNISTLTGHYCRAGLGTDIAGIIIIHLYQTRMNENLFIQAVTEKSREFNLNPLLLLSGIEGLYTFRDIEMGALNYELLDSLILTIFALRIGDKFHELAEENLSSTNASVQLAAINELMEISEAEINASQSPFLQSFARLLGGKSPVRNYHIKALEVAAIEIKKAQTTFSSDSIGVIMLGICKEYAENKLGLASLFAN